MSREATAVLESRLHYARYPQGHRDARKRLEPFVLAGDVRCARCGEPIVPGERWHLDHTDDGTGYLGPSHERCNVRAAGVRGAARRWEPPPPLPPEVELEGVGQRDERWDVPWLRRLRKPPRDAVWPRYMTVPDERAAGSIGPDFIRASKRRTGELRWWQKLVATRLLEVDVDGRLIWETLILTMARQLGKSWLLRELALWRMEQAARFGEPQTILHTGKDLDVCTEVLRPAMFWADGEPGYTVRRANGVQGIELDDQSRWLVRARSGAYGKTINVGAVDEAWKVSPGMVEEGLVPTMIEREQPQLWLISTAHRLATPLMMDRRRVALANLEQPDGDLMIEWSAPRAMRLDDVAGWRMASPHWTAQRQRMIGKRLEAAQLGEGEVTEDEMDPIEAFRAQYLNQWPDRRIPTGEGEPLLPPGLWAYLASAGVRELGPLYVAVEDNFGNGAAVAVCAETDDGRLEVDGWLRSDWDQAVDDVVSLTETREVRAILVGASMLKSLVARAPELVPQPAPATHTEARAGLSILRDLAAAGTIVHDPPSERTADLDEAILGAFVRELSTGLSLAPGGSGYLVKALAWSVAVAHAREPEAAIY